MLAFSRAASLNYGDTFCLTEMLFEGLLIESGQETFMFNNDSNVYKPGELVFYHRIVYSYRNRFNCVPDDSEYGYGIVGRTGTYIVPVIAYKLAAGDRSEYDDLSCRLLLSNSNLDIVDSYSEFSDLTGCHPEFKHTYSQYRKMYHMVVDKINHKNKNF